MCNQTCLEFVKKNLSKNKVKGKSVLEVGSRVVNFSVRSIFEDYGARSYTGIDIIAGPGVDKICAAEDMVRVFEKESFDLLVSTEVLEHVPDWQIVISNFKNIIKPGGFIIISTRSKGFDYHGYPYDFWRFEINDIESIFTDFDINSLESDPACPGIFMMAQKPLDFVENDLNEYKLYSIVSRKRIKAVSKLELLLVKTLYPVIIMAGNSLRRVLPDQAKDIIRRSVLSKIP